MSHDMSDSFVLAERKSSPKNLLTLLYDVILWLRYFHVMNGWNECYERNVTTI